MDISLDGNIDHMKTLISDWMTISWSVPVSFIIFNKDEASRHREQYGNITQHEHKNSSRIF